MNTEKQAEEVKILPCPFCGGFVIPQVDGDYWHERMHADCPVKEFFEPTLWNCRPVPPSLEAQEKKNLYEDVCHCGEPLRLHKLGGIEHTFVSAEEEQKNFVKEIAQESHSSRSVIKAVISRAEQACRYAAKHNIGVGWHKDFFIACEVCEKAIADNVERHLGEVLTASPEHKKIGWEEAYALAKEASEGSESKDTNIKPFEVKMGETLSLASYMPDEKDDLIDDLKLECKRWAKMSLNYQSEIEQLQAQVTELKAKLYKWTNWENGLNIEQWSLNVCERNDRLRSQVERLKSALKVRSQNFQCPECDFDLWDDCSTEEHAEECSHYKTEMEALQTNGLSTPAASGDFHPKIPAVPCEEVKEPSCYCCGSKLVYIRGRYPKEDNRQVCACCAVERLEEIRQISSADYGRAFQASSTELKK